MKRVFLDTNIIIDVLEHRDPFFIQSANLLELGYRKKIHLYATSLSFINGIYISRKSIGKENAIEKVKILRQIIDISPMSAKEFDYALAAPFKDIEDSLQYFSALAAKCDILITRNKKDFPDSESVMVLTPQEFFDCFSDELKW